MSEIFQLKCSSSNVTKLKEKGKDPTEINKRGIAYTNCKGGMIATGNEMNINTWC